jgi:branched-chain amino acid transport system permease protein
MTDYLLSVAILLALYVTLSVSLNLLAGYSGLISLAQATLFGIGAYASAILAVRFGVDLTLAFLVAVGATIVFALAVALLSVRVRDDYFVVATFGFQAVVVSVFTNSVRLTGGPMGIKGIPKPTLLGWDASSNWALLLLACILAVASIAVEWRMGRSAFGRAMRACRDDEVFAQSLGKNVGRTRVVAFVIAACMAAMAGSLYAYYVTFIDPASFTLTEAILILAMVIIGGAGSIWGPVLGAGLLVALPEALRAFGLPTLAAGNLRQIVYGVLLVLFVAFRPEGILGAEAGLKKGDR